MNMNINLSEIKLEVFEKLDTTLTIARERLSQSTDQQSNTDYAILALEQTNGVGQQGKKWLSPKGNLALSMVLSTYTFCDIGELALIFATSVYKTIIPLITEKASYNLKYKYPNDIYLYEKKLGGVLVEVHQNRMIASIGLNLFYAPEEFISMKNYMSGMTHNNVSEKERFGQNSNINTNNHTENSSNDSSMKIQDIEGLDQNTQDTHVTHNDQDYNIVRQNNIMEKNDGIAKIDEVTQNIDPVEFFYLFWKQHQKDIESIKKEGMDYVYNHWSKNLL